MSCLAVKIKKIFFLYRFSSFTFVLDEQKKSIENDSVFSAMIFMSFVESFIKLSATMGEKKETWGYFSYICR